VRDPLLGRPAGVEVGGGDGGRNVEFAHAGKLRKEDPPLAARERDALLGRLREWNERWKAVTVGGRFHDAAATCDKLLDGPCD
jgi:ribosomal protein S30